MKNYSRCKLLTSILLTLPLYSALALADTPTVLTDDPSSANTSAPTANTQTITTTISETTPIDPSKMATVDGKEPNKTLLPDDFKVYYNEKVGISRTSFSGGSEKNVPTVNEFKEIPGCYIACYSKDSKNGVYHISDNVYMVGQIRVSGHYANGFCLPKGFEEKDIRSEKEFKELCEKNFPEKCSNASCSIGSQTANWF